MDVGEMRDAESLIKGRRQQHLTTVTVDILLDVKV